MQFIALFFESQFNGFKMAFYILRVEEAKDEFRNLTSLHGFSTVLNTSNPIPILDHTTPVLYYFTPIIDYLTHHCHLLLESNS